jgi:hypothetical protein
MSATCEQSFDVTGFSYNPETGEIFKDGERRDYSAGLYRRVCNKGVRVCAHRLAWRLHYGAWPQFEVDHRNTIESENHISNLREATSSQNKCNRTSHNPDKGACWDSSSGRWRVAVQIDHKRVQFYASHYISAVCAARLIRRVLHGAFARQ